MLWKKSRHPTRAIWYGVASFLVLWILSASFLIPSIVRATASGHLGLLSGLMPGRASTPVSSYLDRWSKISRTITFLLVGLAVTSAIAQRIFGSGGAAEAGDDDQSDVLVRDALLTSIWFGLVTGIIEAAWVAAKIYYVHEIVRGFRPAGANVMWMAPLGNAALFLVAGLVLVPVLALVRRTSRVPGREARVLTGTLCWLSFLVLIMMPARIRWWAAITLATGLAVLASGSRAMQRFRSLEPGLPRRVARLALVPAVLWLAVRAGDFVRERRALPGQPAEGAPPNVMLIVLDAARAANMSLFGYARPTTPGLTKLAGESVVFDRAMAPAPWTLPSHASMFTGRPAAELGVGFFTPLDERFPTLAEALRDRGYRTAGFVGNVLFCNDFYGLGRGFGRYRDEATTPPAILMSAWLGRKTIGQLLAKLGDHDMIARRRASKVGAEVLEWIDDLPAGQPFFAFLNLYDTHDPYRAPPPFDRAFAVEGGRYWVDAHTADSYSAATINELEDAYDGGMAYLDEQVVSLLEKLRDRGILDQTVVIIVGDHGEQFGEHGRMTHANSLYLDELWVPLIIRFPTRAPRGTRIEGAVSPSNIPATVFDLAGLGDSPMPGTSLAKSWEAVAPDTALSEFGADRSLVAGTWHYIAHNDGGRELYDLRSDPFETTDLAPDQPELIDALQLAAKRWALPDPLIGATPVAGR